MDTVNLCLGASVTSAAAPLPAAEPKSALQADATQCAASDERGAHPALMSDEAAVEVSAASGGTADRPSDNTTDETAIPPGAVVERAASGLPLRKKRMPRALSAAAQRSQVSHV